MSASELPVKVAFSIPRDAPMPPVQERAEEEAERLRSEVARLQGENRAMALHMERVADRLDEASRTIAGHMAELARERDEARAALMRRISQDDRGRA